jgi:hypothetical protein
MTPFEKKIYKLKRAVRALRELADEVMIFVLVCAHLTYLIVSH